MGEAEMMGRRMTAAGRIPVASFDHRCFFGEPALSDLLGDPIARALMHADRIEHRDLDALLDAVRCHLRRAGG